MKDWLESIEVYKDLLKRHDKGTCEQILYGALRLAISEQCVIENILERNESH